MKKLCIAVGLVVIFSVGVFGGKNPADYPLHIQIVESHWHRHHDGAVDGWGRGDIEDGDSIHGFDFTYYSSAPFQRTVGDVRYLAKWKKEPMKLEMLVGEIGSLNKFYSYDLKTSLRDDVYVRSPEGSIAISQDEYKAKQQNRP
jgi:hypothetical protein